MKSLGHAVILGLSFLVPLSATAERVVRVKRPRTTIVVHNGFPIRRTLPSVVVVEPRVAFRVAASAFLPVVPFRAVVVATHLPASSLVWEDSQSLDRDDGWSDFTLNVDARGRALYLEVRGRVQLSFAEVVFDNGETQVVDLADATLKNGVYLLLDFKDGRKVDHVRLVAAAKSKDAKVIVRMAK
jgi:hypothetical protein